MRNLKKLFAVLLVVAMMATTMVSAFAEDVTLDAPAKAPAKAATPAKATTESAISYNANIAKTIGMLKGAGAGVTTDYLATTPTRLQSIIMFLRLKGLEGEALAFKGTDNFADADQAGWAEGKAIMAYVKANSDKLGIKGVGDNKLDPGSLITAQDYYKVMLESLGYKQDVDFKYEEVIKFAATKNLTKVASVTKYTVDNLATATVEALNAVVKGGKDVDTLAAALLKAGKLTEDNVKLITTPEPTPVPTTLTYDSLSAITATSLLAKFNRPVSDTTKIKFDVKRGTIVDSLTPVWNKDKTEATLSKTSRLIPADYTVAVTNDKVDLGNKTVTIEQEKIVSITFNSDMLLRINDISGQVGFTVKNQYGQDITDSSLARSITWTSSVDTQGGVSARGGILTVTKGTGTAGEAMAAQLRDPYQKVVFVNAYDSTTGLFSSKSLTVSDTVGGINDIKFNGIINPDGKTDITVGTTDKFYIDYEIKDMYGNKIDTYDLLNNALQILSSNSDITAKVVKDPANDQKGLIEIITHIRDGSAVITGMTSSTGKAASITVVVKKDSTVNQFDLQNPATDVTALDNVVIPFSAVDQDGNVLTNYSDIMNKVQISASQVGVTTPEKTEDRGANGEYILSYKFKEVGKYTITALVPDSGKISRVTIDVKAQGVPYELNEIKTNVVSSAIVMGGGAITADFKDNLAFTVLDQYGRDFNMTDDYKVIDGNGKTTYYYVDVNITDPVDHISVTGGSYAAYMGTGIQLQGGSVKGSSSLTFELCSDTTDPSTSGYFDKGLPTSRKIIDTKSVSMSNVEKKDITSYEFKKIDTLYARSTAANPAGEFTDSTPLTQNYAKDIKVFGKLSNGTQVALNPGDLLNLTVADTTKFSTNNAGKKLLAKSLAAYSDDTASTKLVATILGADNAIYTINTTVNSSKAEPIAKKIVAKSRYGSVVTKDSDNTFSIAAADFSTFLADIAGESYMPGSTTTKMDALGFLKYKTVKAENDTSNVKETLLNPDIWFDINDQYNPSTKSMSPIFFTVTQSNLKVDEVSKLELKVADKNTSDIDGSLTGMLKYAKDAAPVVKGDQFTVTAVANNGLSMSIVINVR